MSNPKLPRPKTMMFVSALLCIALVPLVYAAVNRAEEEQRHFETIAKMTESDRRQLEHNFAAFQKLPPEKQEQYRQLHSQLHGENNELLTVLLDFTEFLRSLDPADRSDIERQSTFSDKMNAIRTVLNRLNDESQRQQELLQQSFANTQRRSKWRSEHERAFSLFSSLSPEETEAMTRVLESHQTLTSTQRTELNTLKGAGRLAKILAITLQSSGGSESKPFFSSQLVNELIGALSEEKRELFDKSRERREREWQAFQELVDSGEADPKHPPDNLRRTLEEFHEMALIFKCLNTFSEALDASAPPPEEMPSFLKKLNQDVRQELLTQHPGNLYDELVRLWHDRQQTELYKDTKIIRELAFKRLPKGAPGGRRQGSGRPNGGIGRPGSEQERPREFPRPQPEDESERDPKGAGFPERFRNFRNDRLEGLKSDKSETESSED